MLDKFLSPIPRFLYGFLFSFIMFCTAAQKEMNKKQLNTFCYSTGWVWLIILLVFTILLQFTWWTQYHLLSSSFYTLYLLYKVSLSIIKALTSKVYWNKQNGSHFLYLSILTKDLLQPTHLSSLILDTDIIMSHSTHNTCFQWVVKIHSNESNFLGNIN